MLAALAKRTIPEVVFQGVATPADAEAITP